MKSWGNFLNEQKINFEVDDRVVYVGWNPDYQYKSGIIKKITDTHALIQFDDRSMRNNGHFWCPFKQIISHKQRIVDSENDPFGEDSYMFEQVGFPSQFNLIEISDVQMGHGFGNWEKALDFLNKNVVGHLVKFTGGLQGEDMTRHTEYVMEVIFDRLRGWKFICEKGEYLLSMTNEIIIKDDHKKKRILNLEDDPFGEESYMFEQMTSGTDMRTMPKFVRCIRTISSNSDSYMQFDPHDKFTEHLEYEIKKIWGDPQRAIEEFHIDDYLPIQCTSCVMISDDNNKNVLFRVSEDYSAFDGYPSFFDYFRFIDSSYKKVLKPEDDPFGEENYGYIKESVEFNQIQIGDRMAVESYDGAHFMVKRLSEFDYGVVVDIDSYSEFVGLEFEEFHNGHDCNGHGKDPHCYYIKNDNLVSVSKKRIKKLNLEDDPLGEENWGFVQENARFDDFSVGDILTYNRDGKNLVGFDGRDRVYVIVIKSISKDRIYGHFIDELNSDVQFTKKFINSNRDRFSVNKGKLRKLNPEQDPFGEENYGYVQESMKFANGIRVGSKVTHKHYPRFGIGVVKKIVGSRIPDAYIEFENFTSTTHNFCKVGHGWISSVDNLNVVDKERKINLEDDPFGEENYGFVQ